MSSNTFLMPNDLSDLCRVCLQLPEESQYLDLTTIYDEEDNLTYGECFTICTQINLSDGEGVPHHLCKSCGLELQMTYDFYKKVEESKRVIEQCQKRIEKKSLNASGQQNRTSCDIKQQHDTSLAIADNYVTSACIDATIPSQKDSGLRPQNIMSISDVQESNEFGIVKKNDQNKFREQQEEAALSDKIQIESSQESNAGVDIEEHFTMDDYQNVETLEEEETETVQMKYDENLIPIQIKYKSCEYEVREEYVEYTEDDDCEEDVECNENEEEMEGSNNRKGTSEGNKEANFSWKDNVVTVANKEHIPIEIDNSVEFYELSNFNNNEIETIISESSQDDTLEDDNEDDLPKKPIKKNETSNKTHVTRKRHVGSYSCDVCQKVYPNYSRMMSHRRCHEIDRPKFTCSYCGRMYATKQAMECHIQTAHDKSGFTCPICNKVFAIRKSLEIHVRYHTGDFPYECSLCDRKFAQACHLNTHVNVKHNKIRFSCEYPNCGKFFTSSTSLRNHEFTHGVMPFECEYCQRGYPAKAKLRIHIKRKHDIDLSIDQLENMRKFHVMRSKVNLVQFVE